MNGLTKIFQNFELTPTSHTLFEYQKRGGYEALPKALQMPREAVTQEIKKAVVCGRGGAGFPMGKKWEVVNIKENKSPVYLCINADEGEPGTFKDRWILENNPHQLIEGIICSSFALTVRHAFIYIRGEFDLGYRRLMEAIEEAYAHKFLGTNILGHNFDLDIIVHQGAGSYVCGEASALLNSLEGKKGYPRNRPPRLSIRGLYQCPTIVNNVESLANVPWILLNGGDAFRALGVEKSGGTRLYSVSGHVNKPGIYERPQGYSFEKFIFEDCGGVKNGKKLKAVIPGGISTPPLKADEIKDLPMDFESFVKRGSQLGSGGVIIIAEGTCMVRVLKIALRFYHHESCGQCTPCREGCGWLDKIVTRILYGEGTLEDLERMTQIGKSMLGGTTICPLGESAGTVASSYVNKFRDEFEYFISHKKSLYQENLLC